MTPTELGYDYELKMEATYPTQLRMALSVPNKEDYNRFTKGTILYTLLSFAMAYFSWLFDFGVLPFVFIALGIIIVISTIHTGCLGAVLENAKSIPGFFEVFPDE